jgi:hypothetical protein
MIEFISRETSLLSLYALFWMGNNHLQATTCISFAKFPNYIHPHYV